MSWQDVCPFVRPSVCPSGRPSHAGILYKRLNGGTSRLCSRRRRRGLFCCGRSSRLSSSRRRNCNIVTLFYVLACILTCLLNKRILYEYLTSTFQWQASSLQHS